MKKIKNKIIIIIIKKHAPLQNKDSVRWYVREISVAMFLQIQSDIFSDLFFVSGTLARAAERHG